MRIIQMEYPDKNIHKIVVSEYNHSKDTELDYINYYDLANDRNMYSILREEDGKIYNDTNLYDYTYNDLTRNIEKKEIDDLPYVIPCYIEKEESLYQEDFTKDQQITQKFTVYHIKETNKLFVAAELCEQYNVGHGLYFINGIKCNNVTEKEIKGMEEKTKNQNICLEAETKNISFQKQEQKNIGQINVYVDNDTNRMYVEDSLGIGKGIFYIGTNRCKEVKPEDLENYEVEYLIMNFNTNKKEEKNELVTVYKDKNNNNKLYITKDNCNKYNIGNLNNFKYINNQECYEISLEELSMLNESKHDDVTVNTNVSTVYLQKEVQQVINRKTEEKNDQIEEKNDQIEETFLVCKYQGIYFIDTEIAIKYGIECRNEVDVEGRIFTEVSEEDIKMIEEMTKESYIKMIRKEVKIEENTKEEESTKTR